MKQVQDRPQTTVPRQQPTTHSTGTGARASTQVAVWKLNVMRVGYLVMGLGLAVFKWPLLLDHSSWTLAQGTVECLLVAMSLLALLGVRYPLRMLPILLFEVTWKLIWLGLVALPLWADGRLEGATQVQAGKVLWVVVIVAVIPWRVVLARYVTAPADPWRRTQ